MTVRENIIALSTPSGAGAIAVIRISGRNAVAIVAKQFKPTSGTDLEAVKSHTIHLGGLYDGDRMIDEVLVSVFIAPRSYTGENVVEISCHGSPYIQQEILQLFLKKGCRMAKAGEFTLRAFVNGKMDLSQAEAVADLIASENAASHQIALQQMRGGYSSEIKDLREQLIHFASMITLELDFSGEDVEFADRTEFYALLDTLSELLKKLLDSFAMGNVLKRGIPIAIAGRPNVGKSTLLNALLKEDKAIVSEIAGTTRDAIEDEMVIEGIGFRFIDTAGIRETTDVVEHIGIQKTHEKMAKARIILYMLDGSTLTDSRLEEAVEELSDLAATYPEIPRLTLVNKVDLMDPQMQQKASKRLEEVLLLSAKEGKGLKALEERLLSFVNRGLLTNNDPIVSNTRHFEALNNALGAVGKIKEGMEAEVPSDLVSIDINQALYHLGEITGEISSDDLLGNIFSNFCIGK